MAVIEINQVKAAQFAEMVSVPTLILHESGNRVKADRKDSGLPGASTS